MRPINSEWSRGSTRLYIIHSSTAINNTNNNSNTLDICIYFGKNKGLLVTASSITYHMALNFIIMGDATCEAMNDSSLGS